LQSARIVNSPVAFFRIEKERTAIDFTRIIVSETLNTGSNTLGRKKYYNNHGAVAHALAQDFNSYCAASAVLSIKTWAPHLNDKDDTVNLVFDMMNPSKAHFESLYNSLDTMQKSLDLFSANGVANNGEFWTMGWVVPPTNMNSAILFGLGSMDRPELLFSRIINKINLKLLFEEEVVVVAKLEYYINSRR